MVDKQETITWIQRALDDLKDFVVAVNKRIDWLEQTIKKCREHCDNCREVCQLRDDHENRLRELEQWAAGSNKGAKLIATCAIVSGLMGVAGNLIARLF